MHPKRDLIRVARNKDGEIFIDPAGKKPGKGAYLCCKRECVEKAKKISALNKALEAKIPDEIYAELENNAK